MVSYVENYPQLAPKIMLGYSIKRFYDTTVSTKLLEEQLNTGNLSFEYPFYKDITAAPLLPSPPGTAAHLTQGYYQRKLVTAQPYRSATIIDEWSLKWLLADVVRDHTQTNTDLLALKQDERTFLHLTNDASIGTPYTGDINTATPSYPWEDMVNGNPISDINAMRSAIRLKSKREPDTFVMPSDVEATLMSRPDIQKLVWQGGKGIELSEGHITRIMGLDVMIANPMTKNATTGTESQLIAKKAIMLRRGRETGIIHVAEPLEVRRWDDLEIRGVHVEILKTFEPHLWRSFQVGVMSSVIS